MPLHLRVPMSGNTTSSSKLGARTPPFAATSLADPLATSSIAPAGTDDEVTLSDEVPSDLPTPSLSAFTASTASYRLSVDPQATSTAKGHFWSTSTASRPTFLLPRPPSPSLHLSFPSPSPAPTPPSSSLSSAELACTSLPPLSSAPLSPPDSPPLPHPSPVDVVVVHLPPFHPAKHLDDPYLLDLPASIQMGPGDFTGDMSEWEGSVYEAEDEDEAMDEEEMDAVDEAPVEGVSAGTPYDGRSMGVEAFEEKLRRWRL